jgi:hypothetical protein
MRYPIEISLPHEWRLEAIADGRFAEDPLGTLYEIDSTGTIETKIWVKIGSNEHENTYTLREFTRVPEALPSKYLI